MSEAPTDADLLRGWSEGDARAGNALVKRHFDSVYGYFRNKLSGEIEDIIQQTFMGCVESLGRYRGDASFRTYLFGIAHKQLLMELRRRKRAPQRELNETSLDELGLRGCTFVPSDELEGRRERVLLLRAMRKLPLADQCAMELFYWEGLSGAEVATALDLPHATVRTRLRRARARLTELVEELAESASLATSTTHGFEQWMQSIARRFPQVGRDEAPG